MDDLSLIALVAAAVLGMIAILGILRRERHEAEATIGHEWSVRAIRVDLARAGIGYERVPVVIRAVARGVERYRPDRMSRCRALV